jgi:hypothetical protein
MKNKNHQEKENWDNHFDAVVEETQLIIESKKIRPTHFLEYDKASREYRPVPMPGYGRE